MKLFLRMCIAVPVAVFCYPLAYMLETFAGYAERAADNVTEWAWVPRDSQAKSC